MKNIKHWQLRRKILIGGVFLLSSFLQVIALNAFLIPSNIFSGGFNGVAQLLALLSQHLGTPIQTGTFIMLFNIPIGVIGWRIIGGQFTILSFANSIFVSLLQIVAPVSDLAKGNTLLAALFGGLLIGASIGIAMRYGFSTGGMDIIALVVQKKTGRSIGSLMNIMNAIIVIIAGFFIGWQNALFTLVGIYVTGQAVDQIHTGYQKLTAMIVTQKGDAVVRALQADLIRGITILPSIGAYSRQNSQTLMMVLSRYELFEMQEIVHHTDPGAFINLMNTINVTGEFFDADRQTAMKKTLSRTVTEQQLEDYRENNA